MAHIFSRKEVRRYARLVWLPVLAVGALVLITAARSWTGAAYGVGKTVTQPIPFSHKQHVEDVGLDCAYCHGGSLQSASAGLPGNAVCLGCHQELFRGTKSLRPLQVAQAQGREIAWNSVTALPDFVHFHHGAHARAGIGCAACHGDVAVMTEMKKAKSLTMDFCVDCHRDANASPARQLLAWHRDLTDCTVCHY